MTQVRSPWDSESTLRAVRASEICRTPRMGDQIRHPGEMQRVAAMTRRYAGLGDVQPTSSFRGGMRCGRPGLANWTSPLVTLWIYPTGGELGPRTDGCPRRFRTGWPALRNSPSSKRTVEPDPDGSDSASAPVQARGVGFVVNDSAYVVFWCLNRDAVSSALAGQPVQGRPRAKAVPLGSPRRVGRHRHRQGSPAHKDGLP
jgi:hypothetical protein